MTTGAADLWPPRTALFVPALRPERITKAARSGADAVVIDLEDAVGPDEKAAARRAAVRAVDQLRQGLSVVVRVNPPNQVALVRDVFSPSEEQLQRARRVVEAMTQAQARGEGAATIDGVMVNEMSLRAARRRLGQAASCSP